MKNNSVMIQAGDSPEAKVRTMNTRNKPSSEAGRSNQSNDKLITEGDENFFKYLDWQGLANEPNLLVLPSRLHYYYDYEELKEVTTLINMKKLNLIKHLDDFFQTICNVLSPKTNFIGCFTDRKNQKDNSVTSRFYKRFINFLDSKTDVEIDKKDISKLLESHGFEIIDMREINGLTYFRSQNNGRRAS
jgi:hypothetical protein